MSDYVVVVEGEKLEAIHELGTGNVLVQNMGGVLLAVWQAWDPL